MNKEDSNKLLKNREGLHFNLSNPLTEETMLQQTLINNKVNNLDVFTDPKPVVDFKLSNLLEDYTANYYINEFVNNLNTKTKISILVDNDADGFCSSALIGNYISNFTSNYEYVFSSGKTHGLSRNVMKNLIDNKPDLLIIPDSSSNDLDELKELISKHKVECLVIDHHDFNDEQEVINSFLPIISNQYSNNDGSINKNFTGVGMCYMFIKSVDEIMKTNYADDLLYYFSIGQVGDVSDVSDLEIRYLMLKGFKHIKNNELLRLNVDIDHISAHELSFSIIPKINAVCRNGSINDKQELMKALSNSVSDDNKIDVKVKKKSKTDGKFHQVVKSMSFAEYETRNLNSIQSKQKRGINSAMKKLVDIKQNDMFAVVIDDDNTVSSTSAGLLATKIASRIQKPTLVLHPDTENLSLVGSGRGVTKVMKDFREFCINSGLFNYATGHANAFGVSINRSNLDELFNLPSHKSPTSNNEDILYDVDCIYIDEAPSVYEINSFDKYRSLFGGNVKEPRLGFMDLKVPTRLIRFRGSMMSFKIYGISFVMFSCPDDLKTEFEDLNSRNACIDIYGNPTINRFMSGEFPQIVINDLYLKANYNQPEEIDDDLLFDF